MKYFIPEGAATYRALVSSGYFWGYLWYIQYMMEFIEVTDIKCLAQLASDIWHEYWTKILTPEQIDYMIENFQSEPAIKKQLKQENYIYFFININDENAGYIGLSKKKDYLFLSKLYIIKQMRHSGIGSTSFEFIKNFAQKYNYKKIILTVNKYNTNTIKAYHKWGFNIVDSVVTDIGNGFVMDDYVMEYCL